MSAASFGTSVYLRKPPQSFMMTMTAVLPWVMLKKPTSWMQHMDIKYYFLCKWVDQDLAHLEHIDTSINIANHLTKNLKHTLFHCHANYLLGYVPPASTCIFASHCMGPCPTTKLLHRQPMADCTPSWLAQSSMPVAHWIVGGMLRCR